MKFSKVRLAALGYVLPEEVWTSAALEEKLAPLYRRLDLPAGRIEMMTGIRERRVWPVGTLPSQGSILAGRKVLAASGIEVENIECLIHASVSRDFVEPATASVVHAGLGLPAHTQCFDISNACLGFLNAMIVLAGMIEAGQIRCGMVVAGENGRPLTEQTIQSLLDPSLTRRDIKPHFASLTIGCGAAAAILTSQNASGGIAALLGGVSACDTQNVHLCQGDGAQQQGYQMSTDSEELLRAGVRLAKNTWRQFQDGMGWTVDTPALVVTHQVGVAHRRELYSALELNPEKDHSSFERCGNIGSVSLPVTLAMAIENGRAHPGEQAALLGIGSGLHCMMLGLEWTKAIEPRSA